MINILVNSSSKSGEFTQRGNTINDKRTARQEFYIDWKTNKQMRIIFIFFIIIGCKTGNNITGTYHFKSKIGSEYFKFNNDNTFQFKCEIPLIQSESHGKWKRNKDEIILLSDDLYKNDILHIEEYNNFENLIKISGDNMNFKNVEININGISFIPNEQGEISLNTYLKKDDIINLKTFYLTENSKKIRIKSDNVTSLKLIIYRTDYSKIFFDNDTLKIKRKVKLLNKFKKYIRESVKK